MRSPLRSHRVWLISLTVTFALVGLPPGMHAAEGLVPTFPLQPNDLTIARLAQPGQYFDKIGERAGLMGFESGSFEMWIWPWKVLRNFELSFLLGTSTQPILARDIVRTIEVTPEATVLTYTYESFTIKEIILVPRTEPGALLLLDVRTTTPLTIVAGFLPVMQPMWPAGVGGQFSYWDDASHAYVISEGQWRATFLCGSPLAEQMAAPPAHMFADNPLQFKINVDPATHNGDFIPIVIAGGSKTKMDSVRSTFSRLWKNAESVYRQNYSYYQALRKNTLQVVTPDRDFNLAFEWGKVALDNLKISNPTLGSGLVAGFGLSGGGARPGFAWFFGGDAFINSLAMNSYGDFRTVRDALAFTQKWQRQENFPIRKNNPGDTPIDIGKMAHELSQSDGLCDWWNDYRYGYNHADTTPWYIVAMGDYVRRSGDVEFLKGSWKSVIAAYNWCLSKDSDGDGLMDLKGAGLGALEFGKLVGIYADVYTCGVWVQAIREMEFMATLCGDREMESQAAAQFEKARPQLEKKFWMEKEKLYSYGATEKGEQVHEKTPWPGVAMMFGLLDKQRTVVSLLSMNGADMCTDWGVRSLSNSSSLFEPTNYNYGAVWPFIGSFFNTAQFSHGSTLAGYGVLQSVIARAFDNAAGVVPEVFSGELNQKLGEGYHHQGFSTTGYMLPFARGLLGLEVDALQRKASLSPAFLEFWDSVSIKNVNVAGHSFHFTFLSSDTLLTLSVSSTDTASCALAVAPYSSQPTIVKNGSILTFKQQPHFTVLPPRTKAEPGGSNSGLKIVSYESEPASPKRMRLIVEGLGGHTYDLQVRHPELAASINGATIAGNSLHITFDKQSGFVRKEVVITQK
jgi:glycogen debranching enzyme